jgi:hypothetical protein
MAKLCCYFDVDSLCTDDSLYCFAIGTSSLDESLVKYTVSITTLLVLMGTRSNGEYIYTSRVFGLTRWATLTSSVQ